MHLVKEAAPGYGIRDLSRGKHLIDKEVGRQLKRNFPGSPPQVSPCSPGKCPCCIRCGAHMRLPTLYTADAGQAYAMISPTELSGLSG